MFRDYYSKAFSLNESLVSPIERREFGVQFFDGLMQRHLSFAAGEELRSFLTSKVPKGVYYSSACYENPAAKEMELKGWVCADLSFDIDVDHIPTKCKQEHDWWRCKNCGYEGRGMSPPRCPICGSERMERHTWICDKCQHEAKEHLYRLVDDFLMGDLGLSPKQLIITFSGHRGYHVRVVSDEYSRLDPESRGLLIEYILGLGVKELVLEEVSGRRRYRAYPLDELGWRGRVARLLYEVISGYSVEELLEIGLSEDAARFIVRNRVGILRQLEARRPSWSFIKVIGRRNFESLVEEARFRGAAIIDERVTRDVKRLLRLPGSLHGSTGMMVKPLSYSELEGFNPMEMPSPFERFGDLCIKITSKRTYKVTVGGYKYDPASNPVGRPLKLPAPLAIYLLLKGHAEVVGDGDCT